ncbi:MULTISPECIES: adenine nucleotide alpha hydrolase [unclassified Chelatococcus]|uniref:adenine nucleotide alpha hydrolase n=1 Tax=unclassified Chelatococcus TaxID=2638111 RepID=UPI0020BF16BC|nr:MULTISPECIES: adenine nucleotide alpha hydrolase [unclassified Chelatococcus]MCO5074977.1 adenine nucleotide alpha hydrolase [Chelatococcus sp.]CAH1648083.1 putative Pyridinium-3,5-bisthiocarboxylic acid mononucleotide synthase [Hyphomicrobiales bacterium]CAH1690322.1 putative Pyridinium-3,5-bisthiocarboxylic acid mononucleotide synthase [Hyphomicrobiales bacterium]
MTDALVTEAGVIGAEERLRAVLADLQPLAIAVSGGVDSMTLAYVAHLWHPLTARMVHAVSPAVPAAATARVEAHAARHGWALDVVGAGEFDDPDYISNPVNRCYFCKTHLYDRIRGLSGEAVIASGANLDDLDDYRPGLIAAKERSVIHPYIEASMDKAAVRALAAVHGLDDLAELPAQPCLSSRIETGLTVRAEDLAFVEAVEARLAEVIGIGERKTMPLRCRVTHQGIVIECDVDTETVMAIVGDMCRDAGRHFAGIRPYRRGSAFLRA